MKPTIDEDRAYRLMCECVHCQADQAEGVPCGDLVAAQAKIARWRKLLGKARKQLGFFWLPSGTRAEVRREIKLAIEEDGT